MPTGLFLTMLRRVGACDKMLPSLVSPKLNIAVDRWRRLPCGLRKLSATFASVSGIDPVVVCTTGVEDLPSIVVTGNGERVFVNGGRALVHEGEGENVGAGLGSCSSDLAWRIRMLRISPRFYSAKTMARSALSS